MTYKELKESIAELFAQYEEANFSDTDQVWKDIKAKQDSWKQRLVAGVEVKSIPTGRVGKVVYGYNPVRSRYVTVKFYVEDGKSGYTDTVLPDNLVLVE
jgi:hypothetical protein